MRFLLTSAILMFGVIGCAEVEPKTEVQSVATFENHDLSFMFGEWVGTASGISPDRTPYEVIQTERVGPSLDGDIVVIEGRGYAEDGDTLFNAFAVVSPTGANGTWEIRSYSAGRAGIFPFKPSDNGFVWSTPAGPNARMQYTATFDGDNWSQIGEYVAEGSEPRQMFKMDLKRTGSTGWPHANAVSPGIEK